MESCGRLAIGHSTCRDRARPRKFPSRLHQSRLDRIHFDIPRNPLKFGIIANHPVIALILPKCLSSTSQYPIPFSGGKTLKRPHEPGNFHLRRDEQMNMISHDDIGMQPVVSWLPVLNRFDNHFRKLRPPKIKRPSPRIIQQPIHSNESLSRCDSRRKIPVAWKAAVQPPGEKNGPAYRRVVRQSPGMKNRHTCKCRDPWENLKSRGAG